MPAQQVDKLIEEAIRLRRVLRVTYLALDGTEIVNLVEPLAIRFNQAHHRVLWCRNRDAGHIEELLWDRIEAAVDTGDPFDPKPWTEEG